MYIDPHRVVEMSHPCPADPQSPSPLIPRCLVLSCWCCTGAGRREMATGEMPGNPMMSVGTQRNNAALGYGNSSSSARCSHFFSLRKSCASGHLKPQVSSETPLPAWTPEVQHQDGAGIAEPSPPPPRSTVLSSSGQMVVVSDGPACFSNGSSTIQPSSG